MGKSKRSAAKVESAPSEADALSFEGALERLESTVSQLEAGDLPLEQALDLFEVGVALSRQCSGTLEAAERRVEILVADRGGAVEGFDLEEDLEDDPEDSDDFED